MLCDVWAKGGDGAIELGEEVIQSILHHSSPSHPYDYAAPIMDKISDITSRIYGAKRVDYSKAAKSRDIQTFLCASQKRSILFQTIPKSLARLTIL